MRDKVHLVATRSYVSYTTPQLRKKLHENPYSYLHIIHPDMGRTQLHKLPPTGRFQQVKSRYRQFMAEGILQRDERPSLYIYRQIKQGHSFTGIIAAASVDDYLEGRIKKHEQTLSRRQEIFTEYLDTTGLNAEPVLLIARTDDAVKNIIESYTTQRPEYDFTQVTRVQHQLWCVSDSTHIDALCRAYSHHASFYIADGHHRCASSAALCARRRQQNNGHAGAAEHFLAYILPEDNVKIYAYHRLVKDLNGHSPESFIEALGLHFNVKPATENDYAQHVLMYLHHRWYSLSNRDGSVCDAQSISDRILAPLLQISDLRRDKRVSFIEQPRGLSPLKHAVDRGHFNVAFALQPVSVQELKVVADRHGTMPPKSTWIEPKLRSGLIIYELD